MGDNFHILVINTGSTSTKIGYFKGLEMLTEFTIRHSKDEIAQFDTLQDQFDFRLRIILDELQRRNIDLDGLDAVIGRGGLIKPIPAGVYEVTPQIRHDLQHPIGHHASNLGGLLAHHIAHKHKARAFIADPVVVDELQDVARISGLPELPRQSIFHALNQKVTARSYADLIHKRYEDINLIVAHLGGGISVGAHKQGKIVDVNNALDGEGPFSPERAGTLPAGAWMRLVQSEKYTHKQLRRMLSGRGGLVAHLGTNSVQEVIKRIEAGDEHARLILDAMCYGVGKQIGAMAAVLGGKVEGIILTGGIAHNQYVCDYIRRMCGFIGPIHVDAGENELQALAFNAAAALDGVTTPLPYE